MDDSNHTLPLVRLLGDLFLSLFSYYRYFCKQLYQGPVVVCHIKNRIKVCPFGSPSTLKDLVSIASRKIFTRLSIGPVS